MLLITTLFAVEPELTQGFEDTKFFGKLSVNGYTAASPNGWTWGIFGADQAVSISTDQAAIGHCSLKIIRMEKYQTNAVVIRRLALPLHASIDMEAWVYRPNRADLVIALVGINQNTGKMVNVASLATGENGKLMIRNATDERWQRTGVTLPSELWLPLIISIDPSTQNIVFQADLNGHTETLGTRKLADSAIAIDRMVFGTGSCPPGSPVYFDEIKIFVRSSL